tara:strand:+ start:132 stop:428 length:297 start_codon:yes stop_codon:yes gene_type:complete
LAIARDTNLLCALPVIAGLLRQAAYHSPTVKPVAINANLRLRSPLLGFLAPAHTFIMLVLSTVVCPGLWVVVLVVAAVLFNVTMVLSPLFAKRYALLA